MLNEAQLKAIVLQLDEKTQHRIDKLVDALRSAAVAPTESWLSGMIFLKSDIDSRVFPQKVNEDWYLRDNNTSLFQWSDYKRRTIQWTHFLIAMLEDNKTAYIPRATAWCEHVNTLTSISELIKTLANIARLEELINAHTPTTTAE